MARKPRVWYPGAIYHITNRGNRRSSIFYDDFDYLMYLELLEEAKRNFPFLLHSYCLMTNHIHLELETIQHHPKDIMKMLNSRYAMYFNRRHRLVGHVFQGRYAAEIIDTFDYFLEVSRYIHMNPVEAHIVKSPEAYPWSSYASYISNSPNPLVTTTKILSFFIDSKQENYRKFVEGLKVDAKK